MVERFAMIEALRAAAVRSDGLNARHLMILLILRGSDEPIRYRALAKAVGCPKPSLTRLHQNLKMLGFVHAQKNHTDGRDILLSLTSNGEAFVDAMLGVATQPSQPAQASLG